MSGLGIVDKSPLATVIANVADRSISISLLFTDEKDPHLKASVSLDFAPEEALDLVDKIISSLAAIGVEAKIHGA